MGGYQKKWHVHRSRKAKRDAFDPKVQNSDGTPRFPRRWVLYDESWEWINLSGYNNPEYDQICSAALATLPGQAGFIENHLLAQEIVARDLPVVPLFLSIRLALTQPDFCGYRLESGSVVDTWNIEAFDYGDECD